MAQFIFNIQSNINHLKDTPTISFYVYDTSLNLLNVIEPYYHKELNPHAPRLILSFIPNHQIIGISLHNHVKEFVLQLNVIEPY